MVEKFITAKVKAAAVRAGRTFIQAAAGALAMKVLSGPPVFSVIVQEVLDGVDAAAGVGIFAALGAFGWNVRKPVTPEVKS